MIEDLKIQSGDSTIPGFFSLPQSEAPGKWPGLLIFHGTDGLGSQHLEFAASLAQKGYACLLPQWFGGDSSRDHWRDLDPEDLQVFWQTLRNEPRINSDRCALIGFSRGGGLALLAASLLPDVKGVVNFFGLTSWDDGYADYHNFSFEKNDYLSFVKRIKCPLLTMHGKSDTVVPVTNSYQLEKSCKDYSLTANFHYYPGVEHSFIWPGNNKFNPAANRQARSLMFDFLEVISMASAR
ncbi:MAG: dienelactone hydrolase family protein [Deltaproteobacteria bacterium]|nr:dienelactone hydrolase family protein [Deltaproteobacteria bacterium]